MVEGFVRCLHFWTVPTVPGAGSDRLLREEAGGTDRKRGRGGPVRKDGASKPNTTRTKRSLRGWRLKNRPNLETGGEGKAGGSGTFGGALRLFMGGGVWRLTCSFVLCQGGGLDGEVKEQADPGALLNQFGCNWVGEHAEDQGPWGNLGAFKTASKAWKRPRLMLKMSRN